jgi:two-component system response regulator FlrC
VRSPWPGNIRELANALERAAILADGEVIRPEHLQIERPLGERLSATSLDDLERAAIEDALAATGGNRREAAERLGIGLRTLYDKLKKYRDGG